jgi:hypothetical protein
LLAIGVRALEGTRWRLFENRVLRTVFGPEVEKVTVCVKIFDRVISSGEKGGECSKLGTDEKCIQNLIWKT